MKYTNKLGLPIWNKQETDVFDIEQFNEGMQAIDNIIIHILNQINDLVIGDTKVDLNEYVKEEVFKELKKKVANKADKEEIEEISSQLDTIETKKADKSTIWTMTNMGQDVKEAMTGGSVAVVGRNTILNENIVDKQITSIKTDFINVSSNLFNKNNVVINKYINNADGSLKDSSTNSVSELINITPLSSLAFKNIQKIACYNAGKEFLRIKEFTVNSTNTYTIGEDVYFIQTQQPKTVLEEVQINKGNKLLPYESYYKRLKEEIGIEGLAKKIGNLINIPKNIPIYVPKTTYACDGSNNNGFTHDVTKANDVFAKYDELLEKYPNYITKTLLGNDTSNTLPIYKYEFKPTQPTVIEGYENTLKKIILINGIHGGGRTKEDSGDNPTSVFALYYLMKDICENSGQDGLEYLRRNVHFIIIPIANPWGFDNLSRYNANGVDINRNFDYKWAKVEHTGTSAFSEKETQYIRDVINANKDALFATDLHIQGGGTDPNLDTKLLWSSINTGSKLYYPSNYLISRMSGLWQGKYNLSDIEYYGYLTANSNGMMVRSWIEYVAGIPCNTFELSSATMKQSRNNANIMFMMTQTIGNWILSCINIL